MERFKRSIQKLEDLLKTIRKSTPIVSQFVEEIIIEIHELNIFVCQRDGFQLLDHETHYKRILSRCYEELKNFEEFRYFIQMLESLTQILQVWLNSMSAIAERSELSCKKGIKEDCDDVRYKIYCVADCISCKIRELTRNPSKLEEEKVQTFALDSSCVELRSDTSQWILIDTFGVFSSKTKESLDLAEWKSISSTTWIYNSSSLSTALDVIPQNDYFEYNQVIGMSNSSTRWGTHPELSDSIIETVFSSLYWKKLLSGALKLLTYNGLDEEEEDEIYEIGMLLYGWKMYKHAIYWFEKANSTVKCKIKFIEHPDISE